MRPPALDPPLLDVKTVQGTYHCKEFHGARLGGPTRMIPWGDGKGTKTTVKTTKMTHPLPSPLEEVARGVWGSVGGINKGLYYDHAPHPHPCRPPKGAQRAPRVPKHV